MKQFLWTPGDGIDSLALERLRSHFRKHFEAIMERSIGFLLRIVVALVISSSSYAGIDEVPSRFREDVQCMAKVWRETPRVDQVESGVVNSDGWAHPFVQYRYQEQDAREGTSQVMIVRGAASTNSCGRSGRSIATGLPRSKGSSTRWVT